MVHAWMPGAHRVPIQHEGTVPRGGAPRVVWGTTESDPLTVTAVQAAERLVGQTHHAHLVWNPHTGDIAQLLPATTAVTEQLVSPNQVDRGRDGRLCLLIDVVGFSSLPFTQGPLLGRAALLTWLDTWRVPRSWPAGTPVRTPAKLARGQTTEFTWAQGGHFGRSQFPGSTAASPGAIAPEVLLGQVDASTRPYRARGSGIARPPGAIPDPMLEHPPDPSRVLERPPECGTPGHSIVAEPAAV
ncbi:hypothetical protein RIF23_11700 [Lipingzhangella sp. LS1_29]|uniref:Uncharacterized protein n=1 Tax=Lipingzhangella rawalii TaxID=2055835 RepID=A0ABU2H7K5_9ACTN|nr:hypothetical protein [Lipingzhangella rawalii]MDS1270962.1 hypothetical protein [Lipingzhangella rawalii]